MWPSHNSTPTNSTLTIRIQRHMLNKNKKPNQNTHPPKHKHIRDFSSRNLKSVSQLLNIGGEKKLKWHLMILYAFVAPY